MRLKIFVTVILCAIGNYFPIEGSKILLIPVHERSHVFAATRVAQELAERGHEVHMMLGATFELSSELASSESKIHIQRFGSANSELDYDTLAEKVIGSILENRSGHDYSFLEKFVNMEAEQMLTNNDQLIAKLESIKFDIAVVDTTFFMKFQLLIPVRLRIPWISYGDMLPIWDVRTPPMPSFVPSQFSTYTDSMTFFQRMMNIFYTLGPYLFSIPEPPEEMIKPYRKYYEFDRISDLLSKSQLFITTSDISLDYPAPMMPNVVEIGGITVQPNSGRPLPADIEKFMASAKDGVILITFGSTVSRLPKQMAEKIIAALGKITNYNIIWRFTNKDSLVMPKNVMLAKWLPQNDILADPRVKLFITHSGNNGQFEAMYHAVPMIGFPIAIDQHFKAQRLKGKGYGIPMNLYDFTAEELEKNIKEVLTDGSYKARISKASEIFRSARDTPAERAAYWIEHVIRFGGDHLKSAGSDLNFFQYFMFDVLLFVAFTCFIVFALVAFCVRAIYRRFVSKSRNSNADKKFGKKNN